MDWFLYDRDLRHERVTIKKTIEPKITSPDFCPNIHSNGIKPTKIFSYTYLEIQFFAKLEPESYLLSIACS